MVIRLTLQPLLKYGIGVEAHGQNMLVRVHNKTHAITGFAVRDIGGIKVHMPTLRRQGYDLYKALPGNCNQISEITESWTKMHHTLFQCHLHHLIESLQLHLAGGWAIVREELRTFLNEAEDQTTAKRLGDFFFRETMSLKCFIKMRIKGIYRDVSFPESSFQSFAGLSLRIGRYNWLNTANVHPCSTYIEMCPMCYWLKAHNVGASMMV